MEPSKCIPACPMLAIFRPAKKTAANAAIVSLLFPAVGGPLGVPPIVYFDWRIGQWVDKNDFGGFCWNPKHTNDAISGAYLSTPTAPDAPFVAMVHSYERRRPTVVKLCNPVRVGPLATEVSCGQVLQRKCKAYLPSDRRKHFDDVARSAVVVNDALAAALIAEPSRR